MWQDDPGRCGGIALSVAFRGVFHVEHSHQAGGLALDRSAIRQLLKDLQTGRTDIDTAVDLLSGMPYEELGYAKIDHHRAARQGFPEVVYCQGKTPEQVQQIVSRLSARHDRILATRADSRTFAAVQEALPEAQYHELARAITVSKDSLEPVYSGYVAVLTGGTSDLPVAEEAAVTLAIMGHEVKRVYDVGVAGIQRLLAQQDIINGAHVVIAVAGMEGALPSVVAGLTDRPVIAVPTSTGYGANFAGLAPLLTMINSCASGVSVVNIDNGFGAGYVAATINRLIASGGLRS
jgi:NCAIR mutase (PurE)-related protein